jgi:hypothetical protein
VLVRGEVWQQRVVGRHRRDAVCAVAPAGVRGGTLVVLGALEDRRGIGEGGFGEALGRGISSRR